MCPNRSFMATSRERKRLRFIERFLTLQTQMEAAVSEGDDHEVRHLRPLLERAHKRWIAANLRVTRGR